MHVSVTTRQMTAGLCHLFCRHVADKHNKQQKLNGSVTVHQQRRNSTLNSTRLADSSLTSALLHFVHHATVPGIILLCVIPCPRHL